MLTVMEEKMDFSEWLTWQIKSRNWTQAELARRSGISPPQINRIIRREQSPGRESIEGIAAALHLPNLIVYQAASLIQPQNDIVVDDPTLRELLALYEEMTEEGREELLGIARLKLDIQLRYQGKETLKDDSMNTRRVRSKSG